MEKWEQQVAELQAVQQQLLEKVNSTSKFIIATLK